MSNPPPPSVPGAVPPPSIPTPPAPAVPTAPVPPAAPAAPAVPPAPAAPAAPAPAAPAPTVPLRPAGLGGGIKLGGGLKTVALGSSAPTAPAPAPAAPAAPTAPAAPAAAAAPTVPLKAPGAGMATAQLPQATIGLGTRPATAAPVSSATITAKNFKEDTEDKGSALLAVLGSLALALSLIFAGYQYFTDTLDHRTVEGVIGGAPASAAPVPAAPASAFDNEDSSSSDDEDSSSAEDSEEE